MNHTPGPWKAHACEIATEVEWENGNRTEIEIAFCQNELDDIMYPKMEQAYANARLIAAAPDMLAALEECITEDGAKGMQEGLGRMRRRLLAINDIARAAIAKAKG